MYAEGLAGAYPDPPAMTPAVLASERLDHYVPWVQEYRETRGTIMPTAMGRWRPSSTRRCRSSPCSPDGPCHRVPDGAGAGRRRRRAGPGAGANVGGGSPAGGGAGRARGPRGGVPGGDNARADPPLHYAVQDVYSLQRHQVAIPVYPEVSPYCSRSSSPALAVAGYASRSQQRQRAAHVPHDAVHVPAAGGGDLPHTHAGMMRAGGFGLVWISACAKGGDPRPVCPYLTRLD